MIIEFIGLPGSGKSTIATRLENELRQDGLLVGSRRTSFADESGAITRHLWRSRFVAIGVFTTPICFWRLARIVLDSRQESSKDALKVIWNFWCVLGWYQWLRLPLRKKSITVVDQGVGQAIWSALLKAERPIEGWQELLLDIGVSDIAFVHVQCLKALATQRLSARTSGNTRMGSIGNVADSRLWERAELCMASLMDTLHHFGPDILKLEILNSEEASPDELARSLIPLLKIKFGGIEQLKS